MSHRRGHGPDRHPRRSFGWAVLVRIRARAQPMLLSMGERSELEPSWFVSGARTSAVPPRAFTPVILTDHERP
jgi:hypothetical protein